MNQQRLLFKHLIFLFDRKNTNSPTSRRCDRELRSIIIVILLKNSWISCMQRTFNAKKKTPINLNTQNDNGGFGVRKSLH